MKIQADYYQAQKHKNSIPAPPPPPSDVYKAIEVLHDWQLHVYQLLYFKGLTNPGQHGRPISLNLWDNAGHLQPVIQLTAHWWTQSVTAPIHPTDSDEHILDVVSQLIEALDTPKFHELACCGLAKPRSCVCHFSCECPLHGTKCVGTHD